MIKKDIEVKELFVIVEKQKKKKEIKPGMGKKLILIAVWMAVLLMLACLLGYGFYRWKIKPGRRYRDYTVVSRIERGDVEETRYMQYGNQLLKYSKDGVSVLDGEGTILWTAAYNIQNPAVSTAGDYVAVADVGGRNLFVYNSKGSVSQVEVLLDILQVSVSEQGEVAILMQGDGLNEIQIVDPYAASEQKKVEIRTYVEQDGYAVAIALSKDGAKLVTTYFHRSGNKLVSNLTFYSFTGVGQGTGADRIVGIFPYDETLFARVHFADNNTVCVYGDNRILVFSMRQKPNLLWEQQYAGALFWVMDSADYVAAVAESENGTSKLLQVYEISGRRTLERKLGFDCIGIGIREDDIWVWSEEECLIARPDNKIKYEGKLKNQIQYMMAGRESDQFFLIDSQYIESIKLKENTEE